MTFQIYRWPRAILHVDGDAFFASVIQATHPFLQGKPLAVGRERGIATAISYEAKARGVKRGMAFYDIKKVCPECIFWDSDYELYQLFSDKMLGILKSLSPEVERYSVDECFMDIMGLRRPLNKTYEQIAGMVKGKIERSLGITVSVGLSVTKSLAKIASSYNKPSGLTVIDGLAIERYLRQVELEEVWGIGQQTAAYMRKLGMRTACDFAASSDIFVAKHFYKPQFEIWNELRGIMVYKLNPREKTSYKGIGKSRTFAPATDEREVLWARVCGHVERAFAKARRFGYRIGKVTIFLKTSEFKYFWQEVKLVEKMVYPSLVRGVIREAFEEVYKKGVLYRACGCYISDFCDEGVFQASLFSDTLEREGEAARVYKLHDEGKVDFGMKLWDKRDDKRIRREKKFSIPLLSLSEGVGC